MINTDSITRKLVLRPLSDLYKEIDGNVGIVELAKITCKNDFDREHYEYLSCKVTSDYIYAFSSYLEYWIFRIDPKTCKMECRFDCDGIFCPQNILEAFAYLFEYHYDIYGLIDKGLAIDINTVQR